LISICCQFSGDLENGSVSETAKRSASFPLSIVLVAAALALLFVAGCGRSAGSQAGPTPAVTAVSSPSTPDPSLGGTDLVIIYEDGTGKQSRWRLTCDPAGGTHPDPATACEALTASGERALPPVPDDVACTEVYGGPDKATITGTWRGQQVRSSFSRVNGCEISRWDLMRGLLPPGGV
jgi:hypothetical protein